MNIRPLESLTKEELIELVKHERESRANGIPEIAFCEECGDGIVAHNPGICGTCYEASIPPLPTIPEGWKLVPVEPTEAMNNAARDWSIGKYGKAIGSDASDGCYKAMLAAAPRLDHIPDVTKMVGTTQTDHIANNGA